MASLKRLVALCALAFVAGCAPAGDCPADQCGTIVVVSPAEASGLFPPNYVFGVDVSLNDLIFDKLADIGPSMNTMGDDDFVPGVADSWTFPDDRTVQFTLRRDAQWHDGTPLTAHDVVFTFDVYRDPVVGSAATSRLRFVESVSASDDHTVTIGFDRAYPEQFYDAVYHVHLLPRHILGDVPHDELAAHGFARSPIGSGPYQFVRWKAAEFIELARNENYHGDRPNLSRVIWRFSANPPQAVNQLLAGEADVLNPITRPTDFDRVEDAADLRLIAYPFNVYVYVVFNLRDPDNLDQPHPLFGDARVRRALAGLVDTEEIVRGVLGNLGSRGVGPLTSLFGELHDALSPVPHDAPQALRSLRSLGWADTDGDGTLDRDGQSFEFDLRVPNTSVGRMQSAEVIQAQLRESGIRMNIIEADMNATFARAASGRFDAVFGALQHDPSPSSLVDSWTVAGFAGNNYGHYASREFDDLVERAQSASDPEDARQLWQEALQTVVGDAPAIWVYEPNFAVAIHRRFEDVTIRPDQWSVTLPQWRIDSRNLLARDLTGGN